MPSAAYPAITIGSPDIERILLAAKLDPDKRARLDPLFEDHLSLVLPQRVEFSGSYSFEEVYESFRHMLSEYTPVMLERIASGESAFPGHDLQEIVRKRLGRDAASRYVSTVDNTPHGTHCAALFSPHEKNPRDFTYADMDAIVTNTRDALVQCTSKEECNGLFETVYITSSIEGLRTLSYVVPTIGNLPMQDRYVEKMQEAISIHGHDFMDEYIDAIRKSALFIFENDVLFAHVPYAPQTTHQVDVYPKKDIRHLQELSVEEQHEFGRSMLGIIHFLSSSFGAKDITMNAYHSGFKNDTPVRLRYSFSPHTFTPPPLDMLRQQGMYPIFAFPEETAARGRSHYSRHTP